MIGDDNKGLINCGFEDKEETREEINKIRAKAKISVNNVGYPEWRNCKSKDDLWFITTSK